MKALLALEDGRIFEGVSFGAAGECAGEVVFNTGMTGYQEVLSDPSYKGQIVTMTYPLIGNYGVNEADAESRGLWLEGFVVKELCETPSNWRSEKDLGTYLLEHGVIGLQGVDTRALTKHIREAGAMMAVISTIDLDPASLVAKARRSPGLSGIDLVESVTCEEPFTFADQDGPNVVVLDCGVKYSTLRQLREEGCTVTVVPAHTTVDEILAYKPAGVLLSNGPGDPAAVTYAIDTVREILKLGTMPLFGICLGQQILGLALGGKTFKMKFGHHGSNQPVKDLLTGKIDITVQNHGFCIDPDSLDTDVEITHINLNDHSLEGIRHKRLPVFSVQFHPEAGPGPHDARHLFKRFIKTMKD
ncbi:MAG: glutamine-hydrolyzing carbamoyl-phosphate synthase small subunit [Syntrophales bacterium]|jgi:carbamoyl-phosphate synthase small subunit|nr:glutamine-hydrolyzing carbamoyl-phosphate synthase small subunit [Syntrophales bacterium]